MGNNKFVKYVTNALHFPSFNVIMLMLRNVQYAEWRYDEGRVNNAAK